MKLTGVEHIQARFIDADKKSFSCLISNRAKIDSSGYISVFISSNDIFNRVGICYSLTERPNPNIMDKNFSIQPDDYELKWSLRNMYSSQKNEIMNAKQIAEKLWLEFIEQVGISY